MKRRYQQEHDHHGVSGRNKIRRAHIVRYRADHNGRTQYDVESFLENGLTELDQIVPVGLSVGVSPGDKSECIILDLLGDPDDIVVIPIGNTGNRLVVSENEIALHKPDNKAVRFYIKEDGQIEMVTDQDVLIKGKNITYQAENHTFEGDVTVNGDVTKNGNTTENGATITTGGHTGPGHA